MSCVGGRACAKLLELSIQSHGMTVGLCEEHLGRVNKLVKSGYGTSDAETLISKKHADDYVRLYILLQSKNLFVKAMKDFATEVSRAEKKRRGISAWFNRDKIAIHLNSSLSRYERYCWFGGQPKIMSGLLTAKEFQEAIANGFMVKDPGPGPDHGEYSHRLQWQYIMRVVTNKFSVPKAAEWELTPLEQYCGMGREGFSRNIWGFLLEGNRDMAGRPGSPAWVNEQFRTAGNALGDSSFGKTIEKRYDRRSALVSTITEHLKGKGLSVQEFATAPKKTGVVNVHGVIEYLYKWKKAGYPKGGPPTSASLEASEAKLLWDAKYARKYRNSRKSFHRALYVSDDDTVADVISEGLLLHKSETVTDAPVEKRIGSSRGGLNPRFKYTSSMGAQKRS